MIISVKYRLLLWVPTLIFVWVVLGESGTGRHAEPTYIVYTNGLIGSLLIVSAAFLMTKAERGAFAAGIMLGLLGVVAFFLLNRSIFLVLHF